MGAQQPILGLAEFAVMFGPVLFLVACIGVGFLIQHILEVRS
jgi:hypothetical protein